MRTSLVSGGALSICAAVMMLGGCGGPHTYFSPSSLQQDASRASGGAFTAKSEGTYKETECTYKQPGRIGFDGNGHARYLGLSNEYGYLVTHYNGRVCVPGGGTASLWTTQHPSDEISVNLSEGEGCQEPTFCFRVISGTGRFANAAGSGTVVGLPLGGSGHYHDKWSGAITY